MTPANSGFFNVCKAISSDMEQIAVEIKIQIQLGQELKVLQLFAKDGDYYLSDAQGLQIIEAPSNWLNQINTCPRKLKRLTPKGFTDTIQVILYKNHLGYFKTEVRSWRQWLAIWAYFATRGNSKAANLLMQLSAESLEKRIQSVNSCQLSVIR